VRRRDRKGLAREEKSNAREKEKLSTTTMKWNCHKEGELTQFARKEKTPTEEIAIPPYDERGGGKSWTKKKRKIGFKGMPRNCEPGEADAKTQMKLHPLSDGRPTANEALV